MSKKITLDISVGTAYTILTNKNGDTFEFRTHSERCEELLDFLMGCEEVVECGNFKVEDATDGCVHGHHRNVKPRLDPPSMQKTISGYA